MRYLQCFERLGLLLLVSRTCPGTPSASAALFVLIQHKARLTKWEFNTGDCSSSSGVTSVMGFFCIPFRAYLAVSARHPLSLALSLYTQQQMKGIPQGRRL